MKIPLPLLTSPFVDLNKAGRGGQEEGTKVTCLWVVFSVLEFISSSPTASVQLESAGPGWVPGCPISDPLADSLDGKVGVLLLLLLSWGVFEIIYTVRVTGNPMVPPSTALG